MFTQVVDVEHGYALTGQNRIDQPEDAGRQNCESAENAGAALVGLTNRAHDVPLTC